LSAPFPVSGWRIEVKVWCVLDDIQLHADQSLDRSKVIELLVITERKGNP
jgi:hypothetical protein